MGLKMLGRFFDLMDFWFWGIIYNMNEDRFLPGVPWEEVEAIFNNAAGGEIASGKFDNAESSARLCANAFGWFLNRAGELPVLPGCEGLGWPAVGVGLEEEVRFPWAGGHHPVLDAVVRTCDAIIGVESKRFEPFRDNGKVRFSDAYWRDVWGENMRGYEKMRDELVAGTRFGYLDGAQLVKHAFGLRTAARKSGQRAVLFYVYDEPRDFINSGRRISEAEHLAHRQEVADFAKVMAGDEVEFLSCSYRGVLEGWEGCGQEAVVAHAKRVAECFGI